LFAPANFIIDTVKGAGSKAAGAFMVIP